MSEHLTLQDVTTLSESLSDLLTRCLRSSEESFHFGIEDLKTAPTAGRFSPLLKRIPHRFPFNVAYAKLTLY